MKSHVFIVGVALFISGCGSHDFSTDNRQLASQSQQVANQVVASNYETVVQQLYVAYFGRPADPVGLSSFENALLAANAPTDIQTLNIAYSTTPAIKQLIDSFGTSAESVNLYGSGNTSDFVTSIYKNVLGRAPLSTGLNYWSNAISSGSLSQGNAALAIMAGALANNTAQGQKDTALIGNRLIVAEYFTSQIFGQSASTSYKGSTAAQKARAMLGTVTAVTDTDAYESVVGGTVGELYGTGVSSLQVFAGFIGGPGNENGAGAKARFDSPTGMTLDKDGNLYVADFWNQTIRKISPTGVVSTFAGQSRSVGSIDGPAAGAAFFDPMGVAMDQNGNMYVCDYANSTIRKITPSGVVSTFAGMAGKQGTADGTGTSARFSSPRGIATDRDGNVFVADTGNQTIRKITTSGVVTTLAGSSGTSGAADGAGASAQFNSPIGMAVDSDGNVYVADSSNYTIRRISPAGVVTTLAGTAAVSGTTDGIGTNASFEYPEGIAVDAAGSIYVADYRTIRKITSDALVTTIAGDGTTNLFSYGDGTANLYSDGIGTDAHFYGPEGIAVAANGNIYVADSGNNTIRLVTQAGEVTTVAGIPSYTGIADGSGSAARFKSPVGMASDYAGNIYVADSQNHVIRKITSAGVVTTLAGTAGVKGHADGIGIAASFTSPQSVAVDGAGNVYVADTYNSTVRKITTDGMVTTLAGNPLIGGSTDGIGGGARFSLPFAIAADIDGNVYVADEGNNNIRKITPLAEVTTVAGSAGVSGHADGTGAAASFNSPEGIAIDPAGNIYVADSQNQTIRKVTSSGIVTTLAGTAGSVGSQDGTVGSIPGTGISATFNQPIGIATDSKGNIYVADYNNRLVRKITSGGVVSTLIGTGANHFTAGRLPGSLLPPSGVLVIGSSLYITTGNGIAVVNNLP